MTRFREVTGVIGAVGLMLACGSDTTVVSAPSGPAPPPATVAIVELTSASTTLSVGGTSIIRSTLKAADGSLITGRPVTWFSSNSAVATVAAADSGAGVVHAVAAGSVTIVGQSGAANAATTLTIMPLAGTPGPGRPGPGGGGATPAVASIALSGVPDTITVGQGTMLVAVVRDSAGNVLTQRPMFSSSDPATIAVSPTGSVTGFALGSAELTASLDGVKATLRVTTRANALVMLPTSITLSAGDSVLASLHAIDFLARPLAIPGPVVWSSGDSTLIRVTPEGWVVNRAALPSGARASAIIRVRAAGEEATMYVSVLGPALPGSLARLRIIHGGDRMGPVTFVPNRGSSVRLAFGETSEQSLPGGTLQIRTDAPNPENLPGGITFDGMLPDTGRLTLILSGIDQATMLIPIWDNHPPVAAGRATFRVVMASWYAESYVGNNIYFLPSGAPINDHPDFCYFDIGSMSEFRTVDAGSFDIVLVSPPGFLLPPGNPGVEYARFHVSPEMGKATTYVITGTGPGQMELRALVDQ